MCLETIYEEKVKGKPKAAQKQLLDSRKFNTEAKVKCRQMKAMEQEYTPWSKRRSLELCVV